MATISSLRFDEITAGETARAALFYDIVAQGIDHNDLPAFLAIVDLALAEAPDLSALSSAVQRVWRKAKAISDLAGPEGKPRDAADDLLNAIDELLHPAKHWPPF